MKNHFLGLKKLLTGVEDFYEKHTNSDLMTCNFTRLSDEDYYKYLMNANKILLKNYYQTLEFKNKQLLNDLYINKNASFRGFRQT